MSIERDIDFLYEVGTLRFVDRTWKRFLNGDFANNAEHMFRVTWIALVIAKHEGVKDIEKVIKMGIAHDIMETRTGDVDYLSRQYVKRDDHMAIDDLLGDTSLEEEIKALLYEYEQRECIEYKIVKDADNLDCDFELFEQAASGHPLAKQWEGMRNQVHEEKLFTETARKMAAALKKSDPHNWHINSQHNRLNGGDWQSQKASKKK
ncbi:MAG TPA: HD domain-containing protein [Bacillota bacterium]|nr:HD domain-containing protein [Bacillota bacterium]